MGDITLDSFRKIANVDVRTKDQIVDLRRGRGGDTLIARDIKDAKKAVAGESYVRNTFYNAIVKSLQKTGKELDEGLLDWVRGKLGIVQSRRPLPPKPLTMRMIKECLERVDSQSTQNIYHDGYTDDFVMVAHGDDSFFDNHLQKEFAAIREKFAGRMHAGAGTVITAEQLELTIAAGGKAFSGEIRTMLRKEPKPPELTERQREILRSVVGGQSSDAIAATLGISADAVNQHLDAIRKKLGAANRIEAVAIALRKHMLKI